MLRLRLIRYSQSLIGTHGILSYDSGAPLCHTLELPWRNNRPMESCIPVGVYDVVKYSGTRHKNCFWVKDVKNRTSILIHEGNTIHQSTGCILVGNGVNSAGLVNSVDALIGLNKVLPFSFQLTVQAARF